MKAVISRESSSGDPGGKIVKPWKDEKQMEFPQKYVAGRAQTSNTSLNLQDAESTNDGENETEDFDIILPTTLNSSTSTYQGTEGNKVQIQ